MNKLKCYIILNLKKKLLKNILEMQWLVLFILNIFSFFEAHYQCILFYYQKSAVCTLYCYYVSNCFLYKEKLN